ncbi:DUF6162 family protein [Oceanimonas doudoroffii]|uniref:Uncharacterized protein n=1 Tax=Oceanimonas doudoroffii TaxID=84158 RepID=A0A233RC32_9GAMM|nr:hypothetical protein [Oceanimonas doudoroffii]OXY80953.1 hypothetical protein B6S08_14590 [Oceanimonas doudoroffii]
MSSSELSVESLERVPPNDGRRETLWVMLTLALVLLAGAAGITWRQQVTLTAAPHTALSTPGSRLLTELAIAAEEIRFMTPEGEAWPTVTRLAELGVPPFDRPELVWQQPEAACYSTTEPTTGAAFTLWLAPEGGLFYHPGGEALHHCRDLAHWTKMDK